MTKKDYKLLAHIVAELQYQGYLTRSYNAIRLIGAYLVDDNPKFDLGKFAEAVEKELTLKDAFDAERTKYNPNGLAPTLEELYQEQL